MTYTTEQERAEFEKAWRERPIYMGGVHQKEVAYIWWMQAARRAPAVPQDQLPPDVAKRAMEELQTEVEKLRSALAECRDACPIPKPGASNEEAWMQSIGDPESVPAFVKSCFGAPAVPVPSRRPTLEEIEEAVGYHSSGWDCVDPSELIDAIMNIAAAPQPPEAAPVELPEPVYTMRVRGRMHDYTPTLSAFDLADGEHALYTDQQVRELLAANGIEVAP